jgi:hypothetical protein
MAGPDKTKDVVQEGGIKGLACRLSEVFCSSAKGEVAAAPKPDPATLGAGMAAQAGEALQGRQQQLDAQMKAMGI